MTVGNVPATMQLPDYELGASTREDVAFLLAASADEGVWRKYAGPRSIGRRRLRNYSLLPSCRSSGGSALLAVLVSVAAVVLLISLCARERKKVLWKRFGGRRLSGREEQDPSASNMCEMMSHAGPLDGSSLVWPSDAAEGMACEQRPVGVIAHAQQEGSSGGDGGQVSPCGLTSTSAQSGAHPFGRLEPPVVAGHHGESSIRRPSAEEAAALALLQLSAASRLRSSNTAASEGSLGSSRPNATLPEAWIEGESVQQQQVEAPAMSAQPTRPYASTSPEALFAQAFYDIPRLEPQTVLPKFDEGRALSKVRGVYNAMPFMWRAQRLLSLQTISQDELRKLKNSAELLVSHCLRYEGRSVYAYKTSRAVEKLAMRFLMLDTVFCTLQLLGETVAAGWWKEFTSSMPCEVRDFDSSSFLTQQRRFNAALARRLSEAMKCFRKGVRPPRSQIIWLKRMLFCSPRAPEPLRIFLVEKAKELLERLC